MQEPRIVHAARIARLDCQPSGRRFAAGLTAAAAALSLVLATALPVRAGSDKDDIAKALIAALVIGAIVHETKKDRGLGATDPAPVPAPEPVHKKKPKPGKTRIPAFCAIEIEGDHRTVTVYPESCLLDAGVTARLPYHCGHEARIYGQWDVIFSGKCLREAGFRLPGHH